MKIRHYSAPTARTYTEKMDDGEERLRTEFVASTADVDRYDDIVEQVWRLDAYRANPVILAYHDPTRVVGRAVEVGVAEAEGVAGPHLRIVVEWDSGAHNEEGTRIAEQYRRGVLSAGSVGFRAASMVPRASLPKDDPRYGERGYVLSGNELLEFSAVAIPANPQATVRRDADAQDVRAEVLRILRTDPEVRAILRAMPLTEPAGCDHGQSWLDSLPTRSADARDDWYSAMLARNHTNEEG
jgi:phage head maturation protease